MEYFLMESVYPESDYQQLPKEQHDELIEWNNYQKNSGKGKIPPTKIEQ